MFNKQTVTSFIAGVLVCVLVLFCFGVFSQKQEVPQPHVGDTTGISGITIQPQVAGDGLIIGSTILSTSSLATAVTLSSNDIRSGLISYTPGNPAGMTITLPTVTNLTGLSPLFIPNLGDRTTLVIVNATSTTNKNAWINIVGNSGTQVQYNATSTAPNLNYIYPGESALLEFMRSPTTTTSVLVRVTLFKNP